jgi:hypothetical protein
MTPFFYRIDGLSLLPGSKSAGFDFVLDPVVFMRLSQCSFSDELRNRVETEARQRVLRAQLLSKRLVEDMVIGYHEQSAAPRYFVADRSFGGSIGADPETFSWLAREDALAWLGPEVRYTPHNVDTPKMALALLVLAQTWAEYASAELEALKWRQPKASQ